MPGSLEVPAVPAGRGVANQCCRQACVSWSDGRRKYSELAWWELGNENALILKLLQCCVAFFSEEMHESSLCLSISHTLGKYQKMQLATLVFTMTCPSKKALLISVCVS